MLRISPTRRLEYLEKFPPRDRIIKPIAILQEEKTDITVSVDKVFLRFIKFNNRANIIAYKTIDIFVSIIPNMVPTAIPVSAE
jgi:hypothetical protein